MRVKASDNLRLKVTMPDGQIILDSGPLDYICDNFSAGVPANWDTDDAALEIADKLNEGTPGSKVEFITDDAAWKALTQRVADSESNIYWR